jgi:hypothetical protein
MHSNSIIVILLLNIKCGFYVSVPLVSINAYATYTYNYEK